MTAAYFEDHPTDPDKMIMRKPRLDQGPDYERGFIDGMMHLTQSSVYKAVDAMSKRTWVGLTEEDLKLLSAEWRIVYGAWMDDFAKDIEAKLNEKNNV